jgi:hypothetical protein
MLYHCVLVSIGVWKALSHCSEPGPTTTLPATTFLPEKITMREFSKFEHGDFQSLSMGISKFEHGDFQSLSMGIFKV